ncbi:Prolyl 4-hydroxylase alpha subunit [Handroanthus impetiginosus]|uniref:procollagen-proline 4-dioxygenase n=1 Tax=Handroanthus impetiginosus TaxID=429701 RepID=A0A2G9HCL0_9LAMI|nr:Prolyl 4-hydroxylase alpha subunit [Handroanthus impetiginosus]
MKNRGKRVVGLKAKLRLPIVFFLCFCFFLAGLFGSIIISHDVKRGGSRYKLLENFETEEGDSMPHGESGESSISSIPFQVLSWRPRALYFPNFATAEQCQSVIEMVKPKLKPSALALRKGESVESTKGIRTSSGAFISASEDSTGALDFIERKIARATMLPRSHGEAFNVLRYDVGQRYVSHYDSFNPAEYGPQKSQRIASFLLYLSDVEEGGETMFPFENGSNMDIGYDYKSCIGLKVKPRRGDGLLFYSLHPNGTIDKMSLHGSCSVIKGEKWVATKWIRDNER